MGVADDLYELPPEEFTAARNARAKELKAAGDKEAAAEVRALRRPSVAAHALNLVARTHPDLIEAALEAGAALRAASEAAAEGDAGGLRQATAAERAAGHEVVSVAKAHLGSRGDALVPALLATLRAGALDQDVAEQLRTGTLTTEHERAGFGFGLDLGDGPVAPRRKGPATKKPTAPRLEAVADPPKADPDAVARARAERAEARAAERQRKKEHKAADQRASRLEREAARLAKEAAVAEAEAAEARRRADDAQARAAEARRAADGLA